MSAYFRTEVLEETKEPTNAVAKNVRVSLFGDSDKKPTIENTNQSKPNKKTSSWDADLRASLASASDPKPEPKSATKRKPAKRTVKEKDPTTNLASNKTEEDGKKIEMALRRSEELESEQNSVKDEEGPEEIRVELGNINCDKVDSGETEKEAQVPKEEIKKVNIILLKINLWLNL